MSLFKDSKMDKDTIIDSRFYTQAALLRCLFLPS